MKGRVLVPVMAWGLLAFGGTLASDVDEGIEAKIAFEFTVNGTVFPPGEYVLGPATADDPHVLKIEAREKGAPVIFSTEELAAKRDPGTIELVFDELGGKLYLAEVWGLEATGLEVTNTAKGMPKMPPDHTHRRVGARPVSRRAGTGEKAK